MVRSNAFILHCGNISHAFMACVGSHSFVSLRSVKGGNTNWTKNTKIYLRC